MAISYVYGTKEKISFAGISSVRTVSAPVALNLKLSRETALSEEISVMDNFPANLSAGDIANALLVVESYIGDSLTEKIFSSVSSAKEIYETPDLVVFGIDATSIGMALYYSKALGRVFMSLEDYESAVTD